MRLRWSVWLVGLLCCVWMAQAINKTRIQDTLYNADGTLAGGWITVSWKSFTAADGSSVAANSLRLKIVNGVLKIDLVPNPTGTNYTVMYLLDGKSASTENWVVPQSGAALRLSQVRQASAPSAPTGGGTIANFYTSAGNSGIGPTMFTPSTTLEVFDATAATGVTRQILRAAAGQGNTPLLSLHSGSGPNSVGFRVPALSGSTVYTLPSADGLPGSLLQTDGSGNLNWLSSQSAVTGEFYQTFQNSGAPLAQRHNANFANGLIATDDAAQDRTDVSLGPHAATHASGGSDPVTPGGIGALKNTSDTLNTGAASNIGLIIKGAAGQAASLQEWRDNSNNLLASITATGRVFFPEAFFSPRMGDTATSLFFQIDSLNRFSMTTFANAYNFNRYDDLGNFKDTPLQIVRAGHVVINESVDITNPAASGATKVTVTAGAGQGTTNLQEWQANGGTVLSSVDASGFFQFPAGQKHGSGTQVQMFTGSTTVDDCAKFDSSGNIVSAGGSCGSVHVPVFQDAVTPAGTINGSNTVFTLPLAPSPPESLTLVRNGLAQKAGLDYTLSGSTVTFMSGAIPQTGDVLLAWYRAGVSPPSSAAGGDLSGTYPNPTVAQVGGVTAANVASGANAANAATSGNIPNTIVKRDASGNFSANASLTQYTNQSPTGTTLNRLAKLTGAPSTTVIAATTDTSGVIGVVVSGAGTTGASQIATGGRVLCDFDGATTAGDYVAISSTTAGACRDAGAAYPTSGQVLGRVLSTNAASGTYTMQLFGPEVPPNVGAASQNANTVFAGPSSGAAAAPAFRGLATADLPQIVNTANQGYFFGMTVSAAGSSGTTAAFGSTNLLRLWHFTLPFPASINQLTFEVTTAAGASKNLELGLYNADCTGLALHSGTMSSGGTPDINVLGVYTKTIASGPVTLNPGNYWLAMTTDSTALVLRAIVLDSKFQGMLSNGTTKLGGAQGGTGGSSGVLPSSCGTLTTASNNSPPMVLFQR